MMNGFRFTCIHKTMFTRVNFHFWYIPRSGELFQSHKSKLQKMSKQSDFSVVNSFSVDCLVVPALVRFQVIMSSHQVIHHESGRVCGFIYREGNREEKRSGMTVCMYMVVFRLLLAWSSPSHIYCTNPSG